MATLFSLLPLLLGDVWHATCLVPTTLENTSNETLTQSEKASEDPFQWLETVNNSRVMDWVHMQDERALRSLGNPEASPLYPRMLELAESKDKIPTVSVRGDYLYNFWTDSNYTRGLWRRTTLEEYKKTSPAWEQVFDVDALSEEEGKPWVWKGCSFLYEGPTPVPDICLMQLSLGGGDAVVVREFDVGNKEFIPLPEGFHLPLAKTSISYQDAHTVLVGTDTGPGSLTSSGYPRTVRAWQRGTNFSDAPIAFQGEANDVAVSADRVYEQDGYIYDWRVRRTSFFETSKWVRIVSNTENTSFHRLEIPPTAGCSTFSDQLIVSLKSDFQTNSSSKFRSGSLIAAPLASALLAPGGANWTVLFEPTPNRSLSSSTMTRNYLVLQILDAVKTQILSWKYNEGQWTQGPDNSETFLSKITVSAFNVSSDEVWVTSQSFLQPPTLSLAASGASPGEAEVVKRMPAMFNSSGLQISQQWARSRDGTAIPYFLVRSTDAKTTQPTILYGYGGFEISLLPSYSASLGIAWLEKGGAYALANIRGGGEFGPTWHQVATREGKHLSYEDFAAVAEDLVRSGVTTPAQLAAKGGSNGGLLVGNMLMQYPQHFGAILCNVPLLDMKRYTKLLAGASWIGEYGNPENETDWAFLRQNSPYHNVNASVDYPPVLFMTSTADDRVHPGHARKMAAKLQAEAPKSANHIFFYESTEGGHASALPSQAAYQVTLQYTFMAKELGLEVPGEKSASVAEQAAVEVSSTSLRPVVPREMPGDMLSLSLRASVVTAVLRVAFCAWSLQALL